VSELKPPQPAYLVCDGRRDEAGAEGVGGDPCAVESSVQLVGEPEISKLAVFVGQHRVIPVCQVRVAKVETHLRSYAFGLVQARADHHNAGFACFSGSTSEAR